MITRTLIVAITFSLGTIPSAVAKTVDEMDISIQQVPLDGSFYSSWATDTMAMSYVSSVGVDIVSLVSKQFNRRRHVRDQ